MISCSYPREQRQSASLRTVWLLLLVVIVIIRSVGRRRKVHKVGSVILLQGEVRECSQ